jgi:hypothetical protein
MGLIEVNIFVAWWLNETGHPVETDSNKSVQLDFDR